jgi:ATP-dependent RNA helicase DOB1
VLVAAHTSAGKTVVAEYAIAMALRDGQRVIYTSPIKALSNQKYRDLVEEFSDVGLMTGDVTINPNASCLVMTTEILRSMLYRGSEVVREVAYAVFDEVHYMRDRERGVVWEESIVLLPHKVRYVFLSATIPNAQQFCDWISKVHHQPCHAVFTNYRPTPLQHYVFPSGGQGVYLIVDEKGKFHEDAFEKAMASLGSSALDDAVEEGSARGKDARRRQQAKRRDKAGDLMSIMQMIMQRNYDPAIVFSFSKKDCEKYAQQASKLTLSTPEDREMVTQVFNNAIDSLSEEDKQLPQVRSLLPLLQNGIGIHHGGLLPILKEVTEILFGEGLIKVLFATETFAMGINMPAKTVVFTAMRKFDGHDFRWVGPGEYIQMSGRAGRRGLDERGIVIQMMDEQMEPAQAKSIMSGQADPLSSTFYLSYNMLLNLMRVEDADPEFIIRNSLFTFQQEQQVPQLERELERLEQQLAATAVPDEERYAKYHGLVLQVARAEDQLRRLVLTPERVVPFLKPGRLVRLDGWDWGVVAALEHPKGKDAKKLPETVDVVVACDPASAQPGSERRPFVPGGAQGAQGAEPPLRLPGGAQLGARKAGKEEPPAPVACVVPMPVAAVAALSTLRVHTPADMRSSGAHETVLRALGEVKARFPKGVPLLDPKTDLKVEDAALPQLAQRFKEASDALAQDEAHKMDPARRKPAYEAYLAKAALRARAKDLQRLIREKKALPMRERLAAMKTVLRRLGHTDRDGVVQLKGRVGCEISTADELVLTELLLNGAFNDLSPPVAAAMLSCLVFAENGDDEAEQGVPAHLAPCLRTLQDTAKRVAEVMSEANIPTDADEFAKQFKPDLMVAVHEWCKGAKFSDVCQLTEVYEGTIIRSVRRLVELLRQLCVASRVIGDASLEKTFLKAIELIKRDIVFAASLYL